MKKTTQTELKLRDAATQMKLAIKNMDDENILRSCINSFISQARSVTLVMQKESAYSPGLKNWYKNKMEQLKQLPILKFFNDKRIHTIHIGNVEPSKVTATVLSVNYGEGAYPGDKLTMWKFNDIERYIPGDSGGCFRLCEEYYKILRTLVNDWLCQKKTFNNKELCK